MKIRVHELIEGTFLRIETDDEGANPKTAFLEDASLGGYGRLIPTETTLRGLESKQGTLPRWELDTNKLERLAKDSFVVYCPLLKNEDKDGLVIGVREESPGRSYLDRVIILIRELDNFDTYLHELIHLSLGDKKIQKSREDYLRIEDEIEGLRLILKQYFPRITYSLRKASVVSMLSKIQEAGWDLSAESLDERKEEYMSRFPSASQPSEWGKWKAIPREELFEYAAMNYYFFDELRGLLIGMETLGGKIK